MRSPGLWLMVGFAAVFVGIVPILPSGARVAVAVAGFVLILVAAWRINATRTGVVGEVPKRPSEYGGHDAG